MVIEEVRYHVGGVRDATGESQPYACDYCGEIAWFNDELRGTPICMICASIHHKEFNEALKRADELHRQHPSLSPEEIGELIRAEQEEEE